MDRFAMHAAGSAGEEPATPGPSTPARRAVAQRAESEHTPRPNGEMRARRRTAGALARRAARRGQVRPWRKDTHRREAQNREEIEVLCKMIRTVPGVVRVSLGLTWSEHV